MQFFIFFGVLAFLVQSVTLSLIPQKTVFWKLLPLIILEFPFLNAAAYYGLSQPPSFIFDWDRKAAFFLKIGGAVLFGGAAAWAIYLFRERR